MVLFMVIVIVIAVTISATITVAVAMFAKIEVVWSMVGVTIGRGFVTASISVFANSIDSVLVVVKVTVFPMTPHLLWVFLLLILLFYLLALLYRFSDPIFVPPDRLIPPFPIVD